MPKSNVDEERSMKSTYTLSAILALFIITLCSGCANQTTDPHKGGLFSYNPQAYEKRLYDKHADLSKVEQSNLSARDEATKLKADQAALAKEKAALQKKLDQLSRDTTGLRIRIMAVEAVSSHQRKEQKRLLSEITTIQSAIQVSDDVEDPEEQRLELERLKKKRNQLEREAEDLLLL